MHGIIVIVALACARGIAALPTIMVTQPILEDVVATTQGVSVGDSIGSGNAANANVLIPRGGGGAVAGAGLIVSNGTNHTPQLKPAYIAIIVIASIISIILVILTIFRCAVCTSACTKKRVERNDPEQGAVELTIIDPDVSAPKAAIIKPQKPVEENEPQTQLKPVGN
ncbi:hypothetical protein F5X96DRAFT_617891 [Biscogniauxia mediterranea]|nr:hypothetical protein F5X96DRAFT_617891 [Biscogniauxia mediterranea]